MNGDCYRQSEENCLNNKEITGGLFPFLAGATLIRNQRFFLIRAYLNKMRPIFFTNPKSN